ncbi:MAG: hypothetical protein KAI66_09835 [Lentisphaeria bacterium]|nr:hypothetical protein [Lentisphaeria bacterium]
MIHTRQIIRLSLCLWGSLHLSLFAWTDEGQNIQRDALELLENRECAEAGFGMRMEGVEETDTGMRVTTTGAVFHFDKTERTLDVDQRVGRSRRLLKLRFQQDVPWADLKIVNSTEGAAWLAAGVDDAFRCRVNCDSLLMLACAKPTTVTVELAFEPLSFVSLADRYSFLDSYGGVGIHPVTVKTFLVGKKIEIAVPTSSRNTCSISPTGTLRYQLDANQVLWISVAPPKPYDWAQRPSATRNIAFYTWYRDRAPKAQEIARWAKFCNVLLLQSPDASLYEEPEQWRKAGLGAMSTTLMPRDKVKFKGIVETAHKHGMKLVMNAGANYFLAPRRMGPPTAEGMRYCRGSAATNFEGLHAELVQLKQEFGIDGAYFDELYPTNTVRAYKAVRRLRALFGDSGVLVEHHDMNFHGVTCPPATLCWHTAQVAGEALPRYYNHRGWLRYACSTYNFANCNDYLLNNFRGYFRLSGEKHHLDAALEDKCGDYNIYQFHAAWWETLPFHQGYFTKHVQPAWQRYSKRMVQLDTEQQRAHVERVLAREYAQPRAKWQAFLAGLTTDKLSKPRFSLTFDKALAAQGEVGQATRKELGNGWSVFFGPKSEGRIALKDETLEITANADSCAYIERPLPADVQVIECRLKASPDCGMTYGPRIGLRWTSGNPHDIRTGYFPHFKMGLTQKGTLAVQHQRSPNVHIEGFPVGQWQAVRYRFIEDYVIGEVQSEDGAWRPVQIMLVPAPPTSVLFGKTADLNRDLDAGGKRSTCWIDRVTVR